MFILLSKMRPLLFSCCRSFNSLCEMYSNTKFINSAKISATLSTQIFRLNFLMI